MLHLHARHKALLIDDIDMIDGEGHLLLPDADIMLGECFLELPFLLATLVARQGRKDVCRRLQLAAGTHARTRSP